MEGSVSAESNGIQIIIFYYKECGILKVFRIFEVFNLMIYCAFIESVGWEKTSEDPNLFGLLAEN